MNLLVGFVDEHRDEFGVGPICRVLQVAPSSYYAAKRREVAPSARAVRDVVMMQVLMTLWVANRKVYGAHKLWKAARRAGHDIGRDQVARLMRELGIWRLPAPQEDLHHDRGPGRGSGTGSGVPELHRRRPEPALGHRPDLCADPVGDGVRVLHRRRVQPPDRGWRVASHMRTDMVLDALEMARASRGARRLVGLVAHADAGSQFTSVRFTERLEEIGARPSIGTVADCLLTGQPGQVWVGETLRSCPRMLAFGIDGRYRCVRGGRRVGPRAERGCLAAGR